MCSSFLRQRLWSTAKWQLKECSRRVASLSALHNWQSLLSNDNYESEYWLNEANFGAIIHNLELRSKEGFSVVLNELRQSKDIKHTLEKYIHKLPNKLDEKWMPFTSDKLKEITDRQLTTKTFGQRKSVKFKVKKAESLLKGLGLYYDNLGLMGGNKSYVLLGDAARLQHAIIDWTLHELIETFCFTPICVPHIVHEEVIEGCGFDPKGHRTQVYKLRGKHFDGSNHEAVNSENSPCLIGTSEVPLAAFHLGHTFDEQELPKKYCAVSRCYRSEAEGDVGLYRVHYFTKVEMFAITEKGKSMEMLKHFLDIEEYLYTKLGLLCRVLDMPPHELGAPAARKFDVEAWFPTKRICAEVSSASDCTDYQSRRFNIKYRKMEPNYETNEPFKLEFVSTVNGTAVALPRLLIPLLEYNQTPEQKVIIPEVLRSFMDGKTTLDFN